MITAEERKQLKKVIGWPHIAKLCEFLNESDFYNRHNMLYTSHYISLVFNGKRENKRVESIIWDFFKIKLGEIQAEEARKQEMLNQAKEEGHV